MTPEGLAGALGEIVGAERVRVDAPLAPYTTFRVGGPADWLVETGRAPEIIRVAALARDSGVPVTVLGGGSNVLVADDGVRGIVLRIHGGEVSPAPGGNAGNDGNVRADAGVTINGLVRWTISRGFAGLEAWAGTPGTVGGAIHGNAHFQGRLISELLERVTVLTPGGEVVELSVPEMRFNYDYSRLHDTCEIAVSAIFRAQPGDPAALRTVARESLAFRKRTQPLESASAGCVFQNPQPGRDRVPDGIPPSAGALIDRAGLKGARVGAASVSTTHGNFIVNHGGASAAEIRELIERCRNEVRTRFAVNLRDEVVYLGFDRTPGGTEST